MDLEKRKEEIESVKAEFSKIRELRKIADEASKRFQEMEKLVEKSSEENDKRRLELLKSEMDKAVENWNEQRNTVFEMKTNIEGALLEEIGQELSLYREKNVSDSTNNIDRLNKEKNEQAINVQHAVWKNEGKINELQKELDKAVEKKDYVEIRRLSQEITDLRVDIQHGKDIIAQLKVPYKSIEENRDEYDALYSLKNSLEKMKSMNERHYNEVGFDEEIKAIEAIETVREEKIPVEERYASFKDKKNEASKNKANAKKLIESLKEKLAKGEISKEYVDNVKSRIEEVKEEVKLYEAQEKEATEKMQNLEEKYKLKPESTVMEQYDEMHKKHEQLKSMMKSKQEELAKVNEELAKNPDNAELKDKQKSLENDIRKIENGNKICEEKLSEYRKILGIEDEVKPGQGQSEQGAEVKPGQGQGAEVKPGEEQGDEDNSISASDYYSSLGIGDRHKTKIQAWEAWKGKKAGFFTKLLLFLPRPGMRALSEQYLENGYITPIYEGIDIKLLEKGEEESKQEPKKSWEIDSQTKDKIKQAEKDARIKAEIQEKMSKLSDKEKEALKQEMANSLLKGNKPPQANKDKDIEK